MTAFAAGFIAGFIAAYGLSLAIGIGLGGYLKARRSRDRPPPPWLL